MPAGQILNWFWVHISFASFLILAKQVENANVIDCQTVSCTAKNAANTARRCIKEFHHARHHFVLLLGMAKTPKTTKAPTVRTLFRVNCNLNCEIGKHTQKKNQFNLVHNLNQGESINYRVVVSTSEINNLNAINGSNMPVFGLFDVKYNTLG